MHLAHAQVGWKINAVSCARAASGLSEDQVIVDRSDRSIIEHVPVADICRGVFDKAVTVYHLSIG